MSSVILIHVCPVFGQIQIQETNNLATFIKVWGFLKYYHPTVAQGKTDWDAVFVQYVPLIKQAPPQTYNTALEKLLQEAGMVGTCKLCQPLGEIPNDWKRNIDLAWLANDTLLSSSMKKKLQHIQQNRHQGESYYVKYARKTQTGPVEFTNEKEYTDSLLLAHDAYRLLSLARYWNAVEYFFAYKYLISRDWDEVLTEYIPLLWKNMNRKQYHLTMTRLMREVEDSHAVMGNSRYLLDSVWNKKMPFDLQFVNGKTIVAAIRYPELNTGNDIQMGDQIVKVNDVPVNELRRQLYPLFEGSNEAVTQGTLNNPILMGNTDKVKLEIERNGMTKTVVVTRYPFKAFMGKQPKSAPKPAVSIKEHCAVVDMGVMQTSQTDSVMQLAVRKPAIVFDLRDVPAPNMSDVMRHLTEEFTLGCRIYDPTLEYVGVFTPQKIGKRKLDNRKNYEGLKIILVNELTQSAAEFFAMSFQALPNTVVIGSRTAGTDGDITSIALPGKIRAVFTAVIIEYPDGQQSQKKGVKIDHTVAPTEADVKQGKDAIMSYAINYVEKQIKK